MTLLLHLLWFSSAFIMIGVGEGVGCFQISFDAAKSIHRFEKLTQA